MYNETLIYFRVDPVIDHVFWGVVIAFAKHAAINDA